MDVDGGDANSFNEKKVTFIADVVIKEWKKAGNAMLLVEECPIKFQMIGLQIDHNFINEDDNFGRTVVSGFDLTCVQFYLDTPELPLLVKSYTKEAMDLLMKKQFFMHAKTYRTNDVMWKRIAKYMDRGLMFVGFVLDAGRRIVFDNCELLDSSRVTMHNGDTKFLSKMLMCISNNADIVNRMSPSCVHHMEDVRLDLKGTAAHRSLLETGNDVLPVHVKEAMKQFVEATLIPSGSAFEGRKMPGKVKCRLALMRVLETDVRRLRAECNLPTCNCYVLHFEEEGRDFCYRDGHSFVLVKRGRYLAQI